MKYFILLANGLLLLAALRWCLLPHTRIPHFRVPYLRLRVHLRLHPGRGHATTFQLWLRWGRLAAFREGRIVGDAEPVATSPAPAMTRWASTFRAACSPMRAPPRPLSTPTPSNSRSPRPASTGR